MNRRRFIATLILAALLATVGGMHKASAAEPRKIEIAGLKVGVWLPEPSTVAPWPVVIFSHGFHGCSTQSKFLMQGLAGAGYAVFAPDHKDASCRSLSGWFSRPETPFRSPGEWSDATYADRASDLENLIDALSKDPRYRAAPFDWKHLALAGHSLGGYTVLGVGGGWLRWKDPRVKALLALSPYASPFIEKQTLGGLDAPVMYQGGTRDVGITPYIIEPNGAYAQSPAPKYFVEFEGAGHFAWTDLNPKFHPSIIDYSRAFLDRYLKGKPFPTSLATKHEGVAFVEIAQ